MVSWPPLNYISINYPLLSHKLIINTTIIIMIVHDIPIVQPRLHTICIFIFMSVNFHGFCAYLVIRENTIFVNPQKIFTLWIHENFSCSVAALLGQWSISFKVLPYSLPRDDDAIKICTISLSFITKTAKG